MLQNKERNEISIHIYMTANDVSSIVADAKESSRRGSVLQLNRGLNAGAGPGQVRVANHLTEGMNLSV